MKSPWVKVHTSTTPENVIFKISDCGTGISTATAEKIFQPFFTTKEAGKGTGLGLSISVGLIKRHNGKLYIDQNASNTTFVIELPRRQTVALQKAA
jgi:signal transduction histidine kinase